MQDTFFDFLWYTGPMGTTNLSRTALLLVTALLMTSSLLASNLNQRPSFGGEFYHIRRYRPHGTVQKGAMNGFRLGFERLKGCGWYWAADWLHATGRIHGHNRRGSTLNSTLTDSLIEARFGYTFQAPLPGGAYFTPQIGFGYFHETNKFHLPSPIPFKTKDTFEYVTFGFISGLRVTPNFYANLKFLIRTTFNGKSKITEDPDFEDTTLIMNNKQQYRVEIPLYYKLERPCLDLYAGIAPFYEHRHFGGREGFPFDFMDTKFDLYGIRASIEFRI